jgi:hypothetical protein
MVVVKKLSTIKKIINTTAMSANMLSKFKYNHTVWFKYSFSSWGFDMYQAQYESSIPKKPIKLSCGKWFLDVRFFKWQVLVNKMTKAQLAQMMQSRQEKQDDQNNSFHKPTFGF